jgi:hypothetical protein
MCDLSVVKNFLSYCNETMRFKTPVTLFNGEHAACLLINPTINIQRGYAVGVSLSRALILRTIGKKVQTFFKDKLNCTK